MSTEVKIATTSAEKEAVYALRYRIYVEEMKLSPQEADHRRRWLWDELDEVSINYALFQDGALVGALRATSLGNVNNPQTIIDKFQLQPAIDQFGIETIATTSRFMLDPNVRHGRSIYDMIKVSFNEAASQGIRFNYGDCSPSLIPFYEHMGYRRYTRAYNDSHYGYKLPILMIIRDHTWFKRVRSLLYRSCQQYPDDVEARNWFLKSYPNFVDVESAALLPKGTFFSLLQETLGNSSWQKLPIFAGLEEEETRVFLKYAVLIHAVSGDKIIRQGEKDSTLYILLKGIAEVIKDGNPDVPIHVIGEGDAFGEIGFLIDVNRTANVIACAPSEILVLSSEFLERFLRKSPTIAAKVLLNLSRMLAGNLAKCN